MLFRQKTTAEKVLPYLLKPLKVSNESGDEWTDCSETKSGKDDVLERGVL